MAVSFKGAHLPQDIMLMGVRWYVAYPLSTRHPESEKGNPLCPPCIGHHLMSKASADFSSSWILLYLFGTGEHLRRFLKKNIPRGGLRRCGHGHCLPPAGGRSVPPPTGREPANE